MGIAERKDRQKQAMRERILDASRRIVMREGFAALSMRKIADAIEYSPATLYLHFASRDDIAQALCAEGYAQLLEVFVPLAQIADPAERLKALGRAYVAFGVEHPQTYRLIFMEDPSYTGAALGGYAASADTDTGTAAVSRQDESGDAAVLLMTGALDELKAASRLPASAEVLVWAEAFWATLHGIVALNLTCPVFPMSSLDTVVNVALDAWFGASASGSMSESASGPAATATAPAATPTPSVDTATEGAEPAAAAASTVKSAAKPARPRKPSTRPKAANA